MTLAQLVELQLRAIESWALAWMTAGLVAHRGAMQRAETDWRTLVERGRG